VGLQVTVQFKEGVIDEQKRRLWESKKPLLLRKIMESSSSLRRKLAYGASLTPPGSRRCLMDVSVTG
jgi:hypothetical protein